MQRKFFEQIILTLLFALFGTFVLTMVMFLNFGTRSDMNFNEFFTPGVMKIQVTTMGVAGEYEVDLTNLGENYTVTRNVSMTTDYEKDSIRAVYSKGDNYIPPVYEGRYFTQEEFDSDAAVCVVGKLVVEHGSLKDGEDGKKYFTHYGVDYEVIGYIGTSKTTDLDNMVMLNMNCFNKDMHWFTGYYVDAKDQESINQLKDNFVKQFEEEVAAEYCRVSVYNREHTSVLDMGEAKYLFLIALGMICINVLLSITQFINKRAYSAAVKKLCGFSFVGVVTELMVNVFFSSTIGFAIGVIVNKPFMGTVLAMMDSSVEMPEGYSGAWLAYICVLIYTLGISFFTARKVFRQDTSSFLKNKE